MIIDFQLRIKINIMNNLKIFALLLTTYITSGQIGSQFIFQDYRNMKQEFVVNVGENILNVNEVQGSPFLNKDFKKGVIVDNKNNMEVSTYLRYDALNDTFEIKLNADDEDIKKLPRNFNYQYILNNEKFVLIRSANAIRELHYDIDNGYVIQISEKQDDATLYKRYFIEKKEGKEALSSYQKDTPAKLDLGFRYIIKIEDKYVKAEAKKRRIVDAFPNKKGQLEKYIKKKKLKFRGSDEDIEQDLIDLVNYYNSIKL